jgi:hypothetical protein
VIWETQGQYFAALREIILLLSFFYFVLPTSNFFLNLSSFLRDKDFSLSTQRKKRLSAQKSFFAIFEVKEKRFLQFSKTEP